MVGCHHHPLLYYWGKKYNLLPGLLTIGLDGLREALTGCVDGPRFPTGVENMGGMGDSSKFNEGLSQYMGGAWAGVKMLKNTCEGLHLLVMLLAISLQAYKFTKNELFQTYFSNILARF